MNYKIKENNLFYVLLGVLTLLVGCTTMKQQDSTFVSQTSRTQRLVNELYDKMSVEERAAQLYGIRPDAVMSNGKLSLEKCRKNIPYGVGHICQYACALDMGPNELRDFVRDLQDYLINETPSTGGKEQSFLWKQHSGRGKGTG